MVHQHVHVQKVRTTLGPYLNCQPQKVSNCQFRATLASMYAGFQYVLLVQRKNISRALEVDRVTSWFLFPYRIQLNNSRFLIMQDRSTADLMVSCITKGFLLVATYTVSLYRKYPIDKIPKYAIFSTIKSARKCMFVYDCPH